MSDDGERGAGNEAGKRDAEGGGGEESAGRGGPTGAGIDPHADQPVVTAGAPSAAASAAVVGLHGRGSTPADVLRLLDDFRHHGAMYLAPAAAGRVWYPGDVEGAALDREPYLTSAVRRVEAALELAADAGIDRDRVVLFGFSQGACLACEFAVRRPARYGGLAAFAGGLLGDEADLRDGADRAGGGDGSLSGTPAFLGAGRDDPHVSPSRVEATADALRRLDAAVTVGLYDDLGHYVNDAELRALDELIRGVL